MNAETIKSDVHKNSKPISFSSAIVIEIYLLRKNLFSGFPSRINRRLPDNNSAYKQRKTHDI